LPFKNFKSKFHILGRDHLCPNNVTQYPINYNITSKALITDLMCIFSDFDDSHYRLNEESFIKGTGQQFIDNYNGVILSCENLFGMNKMEIIHIRDAKTERYKFRIGDAESQ
jgi:hypothetical protein